MSRFVVLFILFCFGCSGSELGTLKGRLVDNGVPVPLPVGVSQAFIVFQLLDADGKPIRLSTYTAMLDKDGSFVLANSGGELPLGQYLVAIDADFKHFEKAKKLALPDSKARITIVRGANDVAIDISGK
jgi:hypothetical protein